ncbi:MAG: hypothetical protein R2695_15775 [Acidimicrobiales bacterium]
MEAIETVVPLRRCATRITRSTEHPVCTPAQLGVAACPCSGSIDEATYRVVVDDLVQALERSRTPPGAAAIRIDMLAGAERYEEAADVRDRADALASALRRHRRFDLLRQAGVMRLSLGTTWIELDRGRLVACGRTGEPVRLWNDPSSPDKSAASDPDRFMVPGRDEADEILAVASWLERNVRVRLDFVGGVLAEPIGPILVRRRKAGAANRTTERTGVSVSGRRPRPRPGRVNRRR